MGPPYQAVVVPGICGTQLSYSGGVGGKTALWLNKSLLAVLSPLSIALASDGVSPYPAIGKKLFPDGPVGLGIYEPLLTALGNNGLNAVFWGYDWRLGLQTTAAAFAAALPKLGLSNPFNVVAHSMGGLVAQLAYPLYVAAGNSPRWAGTYYLGTPQGGAHWASMCLNGVFTEGNWANLIALVFELGNVWLPGANLIYDSGALAIGTMLGSWPSLYQLLPSNIGPWAGLDPLAGQALSLANYAAGPGGVQQQWLTLAATVQAALVAGLAQPRPYERSYIGQGTNTPYAFTSSGSAQKLNGYSWTQLGDGSVAVARAQLPSSTYELFAGTAHNALPNSYTVTKSVAVDLASPPTADENTTDYPTLKPPVVEAGPPTTPTQIPTYPKSFLPQSSDP